MNKLEREWAANLELQRVAGEIKAWGYEGIKLKLAERTYYTPDFAWIDKDGRLHFDEVKGFMRDDANVKLKVAAAMFWWAPFRVISKNRGGWQIKDVPSR